MRHLMLASSVAGLAFLSGALTAGTGGSPAAAAGSPGARPASRPEPRLANPKQLTYGGENAEAYFSFDGSRLIFQSTRPGYDCDQIFTMKVDGTDQKLVSTGLGRTTCGYFYPDGESILYASTHLGSRECPPVPSFKQGYVWPVYETYDIFRADADGRNLQRLTDAPGYDAEATISGEGRIVFTSTRDGDMEIYSMNGNGTDVKRLTRRPGPDGGPFFSADGRRIVFRGREIDEGPERNDYFRLLEEALWRPTRLEIFVMDADGGNLRQVTSLGAASFAPFFHPDGRRIIFSSNVDDPGGRNFDLYLINADGTGLERVTYNETFDGFPMFSPDGRRLVFASNRQAAAEGETNIWIADWVELPGAGR